MISSRKVSVFVAAVAVILFASCASSFGSEDEVLADKAVSLGYVARALNGLVQFGNPPDGLSSDGLLKQATSENPELLTPLREYSLLARREGALSSVLLCDKAKTRGLAEDSGCTAVRLDGRYWKDAPNAPCQFRLNLVAVCKKN